MEPRRVLPRLYRPPGGIINNPKFTVTEIAALTQLPKSNHYTTHPKSTTCQTHAKNTQSEHDRCWSAAFFQQSTVQSDHEKNCCRTCVCVSFRCEFLQFYRIRQSNRLRLQKLTKIQNTNAFGHHMHNFNDRLFFILIFCIIQNNTLKGGRKYPILLTNIQVSDIKSVYNVILLATLMPGNLKSISFKKSILDKLHLNEMERNPICPVVDKKLRTKMKKISRTSTMSIEEQITSIKSIKPYSTEKFIQLQHADYQISKIVGSQTYKKLQSKFAQMMNAHKEEKSKLKTQTKGLQRTIRAQSLNTYKILDKFVQASQSYQQTQRDFYEIKRKNYALRCELSHRRQHERRINWQYPLDAYDIDRLSYEELLEMEERIGEQNTGLRQETIDNLQSTTLNQLTNLTPVQDDTLCCICCDTIQPLNPIIRLTCNHIHHTECLKQWLRIKNFCPLCKTQVETNSYK